MQPYPRKLKAGRLLLPRFRCHAAAHIVYVMVHHPQAHYNFGAAMMYNTPSEGGLTYQESARFHCHVQPWAVDPFRRRLVCLYR
jgi:hypothetical protein